MTCDDVRAKLPLHLTADLPPAETDAVRTHLAGCPGCRADHAELASVRALLDAAPAPPVPPADVAAIYQAVLERQARSARRWRLAAAAGGLVAAGLLLVAVLPRLEIRASGNEFTVRWGPPPAPTPPAIPAPQPAPTPPPPSIDPKLLARVHDLETRVRTLDEFEAELRSVKGLLLTVAADVDDRDQKQKDALAALTRHLEAFEAAAREQFRQAERTNSALYTAIFDKPRPEGGNP